MFLYVNDIKTDKRQEREKKNQNNISQANN